jgi:hypothetical protein
MTVDLTTATEARVTLERLVPGLVERPEEDARLRGVHERVVPVEGPLRLSELTEGALVVLAVVGSDVPRAWEERATDHRRQRDQEHDPGETGDPPARRFATAGGGVRSHVLTLPRHGSAGQSESRPGRRIGETGSRDPEVPPLVVREGASSSGFRATLGIPLGLLASIAGFALPMSGFLALWAAVVCVAIAALGSRSLRGGLAGFAAGFSLIPAFAFALFLWGTGAIGDVFSSGRFDAEDWREAREAPFRDRTRLRMVDDLLGSGRLDGAAKGKVLELLGPPSSQRGSEMTWRLGPDRGIGIDSTWLTLRFDAGDRMTSHSIWED